LVRHEIVTNAKPSSDFFEIRTIRQEDTGLRLTIEQALGKGLLIDNHTTVSGLLLLNLAWSSVLKEGVRSLQRAYRKQPEIPIAQNYDTLK
jgi:hypothetical protein